MHTYNCNKNTICDCLYLIMYDYTISTITIIIEYKLY